MTADLLGYAPGSRLDAVTALKLAALPCFAPDWAIVPGPSGRGLNLMRAEQMTAAQHEAARLWAEKNARRITKHAPPTLTAASVSAEGLDLEGLNADGSPLALSLSQPCTAQLWGEVSPQSREALTVSVWAGRELLAVFRVDVGSAEGQAALIALGYPGPYPVPLGASLLGVPHGSAVSEAQALTLAGSPEFVECWAIVPAADGQGLTLAWADSLTNEELARASDWATTTTAALKAEDHERASA